MKMRYTSLQADVGTSGARDPECDRPIAGVPVVACTVHSQVPLVALAVAERRPGTRSRIAMTDGSRPAARPVGPGGAAHRRNAGRHRHRGPRLRRRPEAVTVASALGLAVHTLGAEVVIVGMGTGVGTGTALGTTAIEAGAGDRHRRRPGGDTVLCVRALAGDGRERHRGACRTTPRRSPG